MIFDTTYTKREITQEINKLVGKPFSIIDRIKMGGIGSKRMAITAISKEYEEYLNADHYITYGNIELRPSGILIHFRYKLESYTWPMSFEGLQIEVKPKLKLTHDDKFILFEDGFELNQKFLGRLIEMCPR
ncbi:MAG: hypothetical protein JXR03_15120 [Cyclobacteriaceae bacterium]